MAAVFFPIALTALAVLMIFFGLRDRASIGWDFLTVGCVLLLVVLAGVTWFASLGGLGGGIAFLVILFASGSMLIFALAMSTKLPGKRKLIGIVLPVIFAVVLFLGLQVGDSYSWESTTRNSGNEIAQALEKYRIDQGKYPQALTDLVPKYISDLRTPSSVWGWLYQSTDREYSLGFVENVDNWAGYSIFLYQSSTPEWHYVSSSGPFKLGPTPGIPATYDSNGIN